MRSRQLLFVRLLLGQALAKPSWPWPRRAREKGGRVPPSCTVVHSEADAPANTAPSDRPAASEGDAHPATRERAELRRRLTVPECGVHRLKWGDWCKPL